MFISIPISIIIIHYLIFVIVEVSHARLHVAFASVTYVCFLHEVVLMEIHFLNVRTTEGQKLWSMLEAYDPVYIILEI